MTCEHPEMRWLDCDGCKDKGITCDAQVCVDCGAAIQDVLVPHATIKELHAAIEIGEHRERERILKILEDECDDGYPTGIKHLETSLPNLIELIKGEQK
jgi:transcriptional regulator of NAD metabolism